MSGRIETTKIRRARQLERLKSLRARRSDLPSWAGSTRACYVCGDTQTGKVPIEESMDFGGQTIRFLLCETCLRGGVDPDHARRDFVKRLNLINNKQ